MTIFSISAVLHGIFRRNAGNDAEYGTTASFAAQVCRDALRVCKSGLRVRTDCQPERRRQET